MAEADVQQPESRRKLLKVGLWWVAFNAVIINILSYKYLELAPSGVSFFITYICSFFGILHVFCGIVAPHIRICASTDAVTPSQTDVPHMRSGGLHAISADNNSRLLRVSRSTVFI